MNIEVKKYSHYVTAPMDEHRRPLCPACYDPMTEVEPGLFRCPLDVAVLDFLHAGLE